MNKYAEYQALAIEACKLGGEILKKYYNKTVEFEIKPDSGIVTRADKESEETITNFFNLHTPDFSVLAEEEGLTKKGINKWIIDPLDGTTNFFHGFPHFNISIGLELDGEIVVGVVYNPVTEEIYHTCKGFGAFRNNRKISVSKIDSINSALLGTGFAYMQGEYLNYSLNAFKSFSCKTQGLRRPGAAALDLCYVAAGIYDGFYELTLNPWDIAAGYLLIQEAGGTVTNIKGNDFSIYSGEVVASNSILHQELINTLNDPELGTYPGQQAH